MKRFSEYLLEAKKKKKKKKKKVDPSLVSAPHYLLPDQYFSDEQSSGINEHVEGTQKYPGSPDAISEQDPSYATYLEDKDEHNRIGRISEKYSISYNHMKGKDKLNSFGQKGLLTPEGKRYHEKLTASVDNAFHVSTGGSDEKKSKNALETFEHIYSADSSVFNGALIHHYNKKHGDVEKWGTETNPKGKKRFHTTELKGNFENIHDGNRYPLAQVDKSMEDLFSEKTGHQPLKANAVVYSGVNHVIGDRLANAEYGETFHFPAYTSTSIKTTAAKEFAAARPPTKKIQDEHGINGLTQHIIAFHLPKGFNGARFLGHVREEYGSEWEVLLNRGLNVRLKSRRIENHSHTGNDTDHDIKNTIYHEVEVLPNEK